ncbi:hypothetical protein PGQ11_015561 [Apiospora arundinis]|uniref:Uncharacterized protein n=1 Tax=Apiospora arundinis TaxID=335852 RepID=A0ABR2HM11_9PEZI
MDRSVSFGITTVLLPGESASIVEEVMSILVGNQAVSEQVVRTIATLPPWQSVLPLSVYEATAAVPATTAPAATGTGVRTHIAIFSTIAESPSATASPSLETTTTSADTTASSSLNTASFSSPSQSLPTAMSTNSLTSSSLPATSQDVPGLSAAAIAGIVISCIIVGILIGFAAAWLLLVKRKRRWQPSRPASYQPVKNDIQEKKAATVAPRLPPLSSYSSNLFQLDQFLTEPKPDHDIAYELGALDRSIRRHVAVHYHMNPIKNEDVNVEDLGQVLVKLGMEDDSHAGGGDAVQQKKSPSASRLVSLALDLGTRSQALRHIIMRVALGSTTLNSNSPISMLPPFMASFARFLREPGPLGHHQGQSPKHQDVYAAAVTKWRQLSVFLIRPNRGESSSIISSPLIPSEDVSTQQAQQLALELNRFLAPFVAADGEDEDLENLSRYEQENDLREALVECATFSYLLFSQPCEYEFDFVSGEGGKEEGLEEKTKTMKWRNSISRKEVSSGASRERGKKKQNTAAAVVVCPGLRRVRDEEGRRYPSPQVLRGPVVADEAIITTVQ